MKTIPAALFLIFIIEVIRGASPLSAQPVSHAKKITVDVAVKNDIPVLDPYFELQFTIRAIPGEKFDVQHGFSYRTIIDFVVQSYTIRKILEPRESSEGAYDFDSSSWPRIKLLSGDSVLLTAPFSFLRHNHDDRIEGTKTISVKLPYHANATVLEILTPTGKSRSRIELSPSSCNRNGQCETGEDRAACPNDCAASMLDGVCDTSDDGICDPDCAQLEFGGIADLDCSAGAAVLGSNGLWDQGEDFIDCGGSSGTACNCSEDFIRQALRANDRHQISQSRIAAVINGTCQYSLILEASPSLTGQLTGGE